MACSRTWNPLVVVLVISVASSTYYAGGTTPNLSASHSSLEGRWTTSDRAPLGGGGPASAYDSESDRVILFGDPDGLGDGTETWAYDLNANRWTELRPARSPPPVKYPGMAYDAGSDRIILFGGLYGRGFLNERSLGETWSYDLNANTWTNLTRPVGPPPRHAAEIAYDAESDRIVLFGGSVTKPMDSLTFLNDTWAYDFDTNSWTNLTAAVGPPVHLAGDMVYDSVRDRIVTIPGGSERDLWLYDYNENLWTNRSVSSPSPPCCNRAVYDTRSDRIVSFGSIEVPAPPGASGPSTWVYDIDAGSWDRRAPFPAPSLRQLHVMAYDSESDRAIVFGGLGGGLLRDT